jgi:cellulase/cellobiase CelA1
VEAVLTVTSKTDWVNGYCANVDVINNGKVIVTNWTVDVNIPKANVTQVWNGTQTISGAVMSVVAASYNRQVVPGATVNFGFCASTTGAAVDNPPTIAEVHYTD